MVPYQRFMIGAALKKGAFVPSQNDDHEHCVMCGAKFSAKEGDLHNGYVTVDGLHWVCEDCYNEYRAEYGWK